MPPSTSQIHAPGESRFPHVAPLSAVVGAEVSGLDLARLADREFDLIHEAWLNHAALLFRGQTLSDDELLSFSCRFGSLDLSPVMETGRTAVPDKPEVYVISNVTGADGEPIGSLGSGEAVWHTDMSYLETPPIASILFAHEVPFKGGDTWLAGMNAAYRDLPEDLKHAIRGKSIKHDMTYNSGGYVRQGVRRDDNPETSEGAVHPIVCAHPDTGTPALYLGRRRNAHIVELEVDESEKLLNALWDHAVCPAFSIRHRWQVGDLLLWDNRCTLHRRDHFSDSARRVMHRTQISGRQPLKRAAIG